MPVILAAITIWQLPPLLTLNLFTIYAVTLLLRAAFSSRACRRRGGAAPVSVGGVYLGRCSDMMYSGHGPLVLATLFIVTYTGHGAERAGRHLCRAGPPAAAHDAPPLLI